MLSTWSQCLSKCYYVIQAAPRPNAASMTVGDMRAEGSMEGGSLTSGPRKYRKVSIADDLVDKIEKIVEDGHLGYRSTSDFIHEAVRLPLQDLHKREP